MSWGGGVRRRMARQIKANFADPEVRRPGGTCIAAGSRVSRLLCIIAVSQSLMGCIFRDFDYEDPPNLPPSVVATSETPFDHVYVVDLDAVPGGDAGPSTDLEFVATIRDANVGDSLIAYKFLDRTPLNPRAQFDPIDILPEQDESPRERGPIRFTIPRALITNPGCHTVSVYVSRSFTSPFENPTADAADLGFGVWFVAAINAAQPSVDMLACPQRTDM